MKKLMAIILTIAIVMSLCVVPASAAGSGVTITITPDKDKVDTATGDVIVTYTVKAKVNDPTLKVGALTITLDPGAGLTLAEETKKKNPNFYYQANAAQYQYNEETNDTGIFETVFSYAPKTKTFVASGTTNARNLNSTHGEVILMTIMGKIAKGTTGSVTLGTSTANYGDPSGEAASIADCDVTSASVTILKAPISSVTASVEKPVAGNALDFAGTVDSSAPYSIAKVEWFEGTNASGTPVTAPATAKAEQQYYARITLTAGSGESFADSVTIPTGYTKDSSSTSSKLVLTKTFDATGSLPAAIVGTAPTDMTGLKYNGSEQVLLGSVGIANGGTMQYSLDNSSWSAAIPTGKDAKTYTVYYKAVGDSGHSDSAVANIQVTIDPKEISGVTIGTIADQPYTGSAITPAPEVKDGTKTLVKDKDYTVSCTNNKYVGTNTATLTITGKGNYTGTKAANFTITAVNQNPTFTTPKDLVKGGHRLNLTTLVDGAKGDMIFTIASGNAANLETGNTLVSTGTTGVVTINVTIKAKDVNGDGKNEYNAYTGTNAITVNVIDKTSDTATMKVSQSDITYGESVSPSVTNKPDGTDTVRYTYEGRDGTTYSNSAAPTNVGKYKVKAKCESSTTIYKAEDDFEILPKSISGMTVTLDKTSLEYNGSAQTVNVTGVGSLTAADYTVTSGNSGTDVGSYTVTVTGNGNYKDTAKATWKITPATLTVTPDANQSKKFKEADPAALTYTFSGNASGQTPAFNGKLDREAGENVGTYAIKLGNLALTDNGTFKASNYTLKLSSPTVKFEIKKTDAPVPTGLKGVKGNELATVVLPTGWEWKASNTTMDNLGSHPFKAKYTDTTGNYNNATDVDVTVEVLAKTGVSSSITFHDGKLVYNGHGQEYKNASISGITAGGTPSWTYTYAVDLSTATATLDATTGLPLTVGKYKVTAIYEDSANYGTATATLEITPAKPTGTPTFTKITEKGKTLADANLGMGTLTPTGGTLDWVDDSDHVLPGNTKVEANKEYKWRYTPASADAVNYAPVYGTIVVYPVSTGIVIYSPCYTIKASAGANGSISPAGWCSVVENGNQTFTFTPDKGYTVAKVLVDGKSVGAVKSYTFKNVTKDHTIEVIFMKSNGNPATGVFVMP